jgi:hypothetical protein
MPLVKELTRSFAGGEITPEMYGRLDNVKFQTGLALCRNAMVLPHGPVTKRPGFAYVNTAGNSTLQVRLIPFAFSATQTMVLEFGHNYIRFHTLGQTLVSGGSPYQISSPYASTDLFDLEYTQSSDVITITHKSYPVYELRRLSALSWTLTAPTLGATPTVPGTPTGAATAGTGTPYNRNMYYKVTMVTPDGVEESLASAYLMLSNDLSLSGAKNVVNWSAVTGAGTYRVYKAMNNPGRLYGYIGETSDVTFTDDNITADYSRNPPATTIRLDTAGNYPSAVGYYEQRRMFAGTTNNPQTVYGTKSATESNLNASLPSNAADALSFTIKAQQQNAIKHLIPLNDLIALTVGGAWKIAASNSQALTPSNLSVRGQTFYGSNSVHPILTGSSCLYVETNGRRVRDLAFNWQAQVYAADDRSIMAPHLFNGYTLSDAAYSRSPDQVAWFVRSDGVLLGMSYVPEHQVFGWHQHVTDGKFESVCVVAENNEDILYALVNRTIGGVTKRMIERMSTRVFATQGDSFYVDSGGTYSGSPTTVITGLSWLEGKTLVALADGAVVKNLVVSSGAITLPTAASKVQIGLPFVTDIQTLPMALESAMAGGQGTMKSVDYAYLRVNRTGILAVGPSSDRLNTIPPRTNENYDTPPRLRSEVLDLLVAPDITPDAQLWIQSADPTPLTLSAITMKVAVGG